MSDAQTYRLHGLTVRSDLPIAAAPAPPRSRVDLIVTSRVHDYEPATPAGAVLAGDPEGRWYTVVATTEGTVIDVPGLCRFTIDDALATAECVIFPGADPGMAAILAGGNLIATVLGLAGVGVLHASTVVAGDRAIAIAGPSGMGKSTVAAILCAAGGLLAGDDVLRMVEPGLLCLPGSTQIRLRQQARALAGPFDDAQPTPDDRVAITPAPAAIGAPLAAVLLPRPSRERDAVECVRLSQSSAAAEMLRCARIFGWRHRPALQAQFDLATRVASSVPVFEAHIPWGPPFPPSIAGDVLAAVP